MANTNDRLRVAISVELVRRGMSQRDLAQKIGKSDAWLSLRLTGSVVLDMSDLELIAGGLDMTVFDLVESARRERDAANGSAA